MYNGSALLVNCFCGHCVIFPYPRIPEPADGPADALFPAQRSVASGGHKHIRISVFLCRFSFLHTALSLLVPSQADNSRCLLPRYFPRNGCLPRGRFSSMPAMLFHRETFTCPAEREKAFKEYKRLFGLCHWPGCKHDVFGYSGPACLLLGALHLSSPALIWGCFIGMLSEVAACSLLCSPHSSFLPNNILIIFRVAGVVLLCAALISAARKYSDI